MKTEQGFYSCAVDARQPTAASSGASDLKIRKAMFYMQNRHNDTEGSNHPSQMTDAKHRLARASKVRCSAYPLSSGSREASEKLIKSIQQKRDPPPSTACPSALPSYCAWRRQVTCACHLCCASHRCTVAPLLGVFLQSYFIISTFKFYLPIPCVYAHMHSIARV